MHFFSLFSESNTASVNFHLSIDYCQILSRMRQLVCVWQPFKAGNRVNISENVKNLNVLIKLYFLRRKTSLKPRINLNNMMKSPHHHFQWWTRLGCERANRNVGAMFAHNFRKCRSGITLKECLALFDRNANEFHQNTPEIKQQLDQSDSRTKRRQRRLLQD